MPYLDLDDFTLREEAEETMVLLLDDRDRFLVRSEEAPGGVLEDEGAGIVAETEEGGLQVIRGVSEMTLDALAQRHLIVKEPKDSPMDSERWVPNGGFFED